MKKDLKTLLAEVKAMLFAAPADDPTDPNSPNYVDPAKGAKDGELKGKDGKVYKAAKLEAGETIEVADDAGAYTPAPDGDVELEDGTVLTVKGGKIETVKAAEAMAAPAADATAAAVPEVTKADLAGLDGHIKAMAKLIATLTANAATTQTAQATQMKAMFDLVEALSDESEEEPTAKKKSAFKVINKKDDARANLKNAFAEANSK